MTPENSPPPSSEANSVTESTRAATDQELAAIDPGLARLDLTGYAIPLFDGAIRVFEPPAPVRGEKASLPARLVEIQFLGADGRIIAVGANRNMMNALIRAFGKTLRVGDEFYSQKW